MIIKNSGIFKENSHDLDQLANGARRSDYDSIHIPFDFQVHNGYHAELRPLHQKTEFAFK